MAVTKNLKLYNKKIQVKEPVKNFTTEIKINDQEMVISTNKEIVLEVKEVVPEAKEEYKTTAELMSKHYTDKIEEEEVPIRKTPKYNKSKK